MIRIPIKLVFIVAVQVLDLKFAFGAPNRQWRLLRELHRLVSGSATDREERQRRRKPRHVARMNATLCHRARPIPLRLFVGRDGRVGGRDLGNVVVEDDLHRRRLFLGLFFLRLFFLWDVDPEPAEEIGPRLRARGDGGRCEGRDARGHPSLRRVDEVCWRRGRRG